MMGDDMETSEIVITAVVAILAILVAPFALGAMLEFKEIWLMAWKDFFDRFKR